MHSTGCRPAVPFAARRRSDAPRAAARPAGTPPRPRRRCAAACPATAAYGVPNCRKSSSTYSPMKTSRVEHRRAEKHHKPRQRLGHDELGADDAGQKPDQGLGQTPDPDARRVDSASWTSPANVPVNSPVDRSRRQRHVDDHHQHEVDARRCRADEARERGLKRERRGNGQDDPAALTRRSPRPLRAPGSASARPALPRGW